MCALPANRRCAVYNEMYNPTGHMQPAEMTFPVDDNSFDFVTLFSVFTHMYEDAVKRYFVELKRVLRPTGRAVVSGFMLTDCRMAGATRKHPEMVTATDVVMANKLNEYTYFMWANKPLAAIGYGLDQFVGFAAEAGFSVVYASFGRWAGYDAQRCPPGSYPPVPTEEKFEHAMGGFGFQDFLVLQLS